MIVEHLHIFIEKLMFLFSFVICRQVFTALLITINFSHKKHATQRMMNTKRLSRSR